MRSRILHVALVSSVLAIVLFGGPLAVLASRYLTDDARDNFRKEIVAAARDLTAEYGDGEPSELPSFSSTAAAYYGEHGRLRFGDGPDRLDDRMRRALDGETASSSTGDELMMAAPVYDHDEIAGAVWATYSLADVNLKIYLVWLSMAGLALLALAVAIVMARRNAARLAAPLERVAHAAASLGDVQDVGPRALRSGIAEIDQVSEALAAAGVRIRDTLERERAFSSGASHQLRTPITGIRFTLEAAVDAPPDELREAVRTAITATDRLTRTIEDLLALTRERRRATTIVRLAELLDDVRDDWTDQLQRAGRSLTIADDASDAQLAQTSDAAVRQVLHVLIDNAYRHGRGPITVEAHHADHTITIDVSDQGEGLPVQLDELIDRDRTSARGHGLGLRLARRIAHEAGGTLQLTRPSPPTFTLRLPR